MTQKDASNHFAPNKPGLYWASTTFNNPKSYDALVRIGGAPPYLKPLWCFKLNDWKMTTEISIESDERYPQPYLMIHDTGPSWYEIAVGPMVEIPDPRLKWVG